MPIFPFDMREECPDIQMTLELQARAGRVTGRLTAPGEEDRQFSGYLELVSLIEEVRSTSRVTTANTITSQRG
jgi:hypothetical protein